ncbi:MAG: hypothetical protein C4320_08385, partial [Armatimonadota bacterium]
VATNLLSHRMPPEGMPQPTKAQREAVAAWVNSATAQDCRLADPGRVTIRRLNRAEYNNTIRDLTGLEITPADDFPSDDVGYGFDNIGDVLSISPLLMERYIAAAEQVAKLAIRVPRMRSVPIGSSGYQITPGATERENGVFFYANATVTGSFEVEVGGNYRLRFALGQDAAGTEPAKAEITLNGRPLGTFDVTAPTAKPEAV